MNIVELYSGSSNFSNEMRKRGHNVIDIDLSEKTPALIHDDVSKYTYKDLCNLFEDKKVDFIFAAPDIGAYFGFNKPSREQLLWENILNKAKCKFVVEHVSFFYREKDFRKKKKTFYLDYSKIDDISKRLAPISTNCKDLEKFITKNMNKEYDTSSLVHYNGETPHKLVMMLAEYVDSLSKKETK